MKKKIVNISDAPKPIAPYSQAVLAGDTLYISGQIAIDPYTGKLVDGGATEQTKRVMENIRAILKEANMDFSNVVCLQCKQLHRSPWGSTVVQRSDHSMIFLTIGLLSYQKNMKTYLLIWLICSSTTIAICSQRV